MTLIVRARQVGSVGDPPSVSGRVVGSVSDAEEAIAQLIRNRERAVARLRAADPEDREWLQLPPLRVDVVDTDTGEVAVEPQLLFSPVHT